MALGGLARFAGLELGLWAGLYGAYLTTGYTLLPSAPIVAAKLPSTIGARLPSLETARPASTIGWIPPLSRPALGVA